MAVKIDLDELSEAINSGKINVHANGGNYDLTGIPIDEFGKVDFGTGLASKGRLESLQPIIESSNIPNRNYINLNDGSAVGLAKQKARKKQNRIEKARNEKIRQASKEEVASRSLSSQFAEYKQSTGEIGGRYSYDKEKVAEYRAVDTRFGNSRLKDFVKNLDAKAENTLATSKAEYENLVKGLSQSLAVNNESAVALRDEAKLKFEKAVSETSAQTKNSLYRYLDDRVGFSSQRDAWQKLVNDSGWSGLTGSQKDALLKQNSQLMELQKKGYLGVDGLNLEKARSDSYEAFLGTEKGTSLMRELKTVENLGADRIYGSAGIAEKEVLGLLNRKAPSQNTKEILQESLKGGKLGSVGKIAIGALMTAGLVSALSDSRGSQTSAQLYGQAPLY